MSIPSPPFSRRRDLDVARELVVVGLIFFHTAVIFSDVPYYVKNEPPEPAVMFIFMLTAPWGMPLLFSIAGFGIWHSLQKRTVVEFVRERLQRLFIPFIVGLVIIVPPQIYYKLRYDLRLSGDQAYQELYAQFYPRFVQMNFPCCLFEAAHLWFLYDLLVFTLLLLPVSLYLRQPRGRQLIEQITRFFVRPWAVFLLALPIGAIEAALGTEMQGGWNQWVYIVFLIYGFLFAADARFRQALCRSRKSALVLAVVVSAGDIIGFSIHPESARMHPDQAYDLASVTLRFFKGFAGWCWIVVILGFLEHARKTRQIKRTMRDSFHESPVPPRNGGFLAGVERYANEAVLPVYILHQTVIVAIGFYVVQWHTSALSKFLIISLASLAITLLLYEIVVKRTRLTRFLFGMK